MKPIWGIHNDRPELDLVSDGFVSIGWQEIGDIREVGPDREDLKARLAETYPDAKPGAIPVWAGVLLRFAFEMQVGDFRRPGLRPALHLARSAAWVVSSGRSCRRPGAGKTRRRSNPRWGRRGQIRRPRICQAAFGRQAVPAVSHPAMASDRKASPLAGSGYQPDPSAPT